MKDWRDCYRYLENHDVHVLDCAGSVDEVIGLERLRRLSRELEARPARDGVQRLLVDFRQTEWASEETHRELSRATRHDFGLNGENPALRLAFVSRGSAGAASGSEQWFDDDEQALAWLIDAKASWANRAVIRQARLSDAESIARVQVASAEHSLAPLAREWPAADLARRTEHWVESLQAADRVDLVATVADQVVGFIGGGPPRKQTVPGAVEIYVMHVLPTHRGTGIGGQLWELACTTLRGPTPTPLHLETLAELPCCSFYDARGGEVLTRTAGTFFGGAVTHVVYHWPASKSHQRGSSRQALPNLVLALETN